MFRRLRRWLLLLRGRYRLARNVCPGCASGALSRYWCQCCGGWSPDGNGHHGRSPGEAWLIFWKQVHE